MRIIFTITGLLCCILLSAQDITGTWEGELVTGGNAFEGIQRISKMKWELVQVEKEVFGIIYFYPQDTKPTDKPNAWYTWYGTLGKKTDFPFPFIQGRYIDGMGGSNVYQFIVEFKLKDSAEELLGRYYTQLEALYSKERAADFYRVKRVSTIVSDRLWLKRKEKEIIQKLNRQKF